MIYRRKVCKVEKVKIFEKKKIFFFILKNKNYLFYGKHYFIYLFEIKKNIFFFLK
jgi:hypothetical protein